MKKIYLFLLLSMFAHITVFAQRVINLNNENTVSLKTTVPVIVPQEYLKDAKEARTFALNPILKRPGNVSVGDIVNLQLFDDQIYMSKVADITTDVNGTLVLTLDLPEYPMAYAFIITEKKGKSFVNVSIPELGKSFGSRCNVSSSVDYLIEIDGEKRESPVLGHDVVEIPEGIEIPINTTTDSTVSLRASQEIQTTCIASSDLGVNDPAIIDLLIVYTPAAAATSYVSQHGGVDAVIANMIALGNRCLSNSQTGITLRLAHSEQIDYAETNDMGISLSHLQDSSDGYMDNVHAMRKQYNADLVQLLTTDSNSGGLGYSLNNSNYAATGMYEYGFSVCWITQVGDDYPCSVHELGHNMGLGHGAQQTSVTADGIFSYSKGWRWQGSQNNVFGNKYYTSVMSYAGNYYSDGLISQYTPYFSNPNISYLGAATGNATQADAARSLREMKHVIAFYSDKLAYIPSVPTNIVVSSPTNGGATVSWDACEGAVKYKVCVFVNGNSGSYYPLGSTNPTLTFNYGSATFSPCTTYSFFVQAVNECDDTVSSPILTFTTKCATDPTVTTLEATGVSHNVATLGKTVTPNGASVITQGFMYRASSSPIWLTSMDGNLTDLTPVTEYKFYAFAETALGTFNGKVLTFTTSEYVAPLVVTSAATGVTQTMAVLNKIVTAGSETIAEEGFYYKKTTDSDWILSSTGDLTGLSADTQYQFYAYVTTASGTINGDILTFTTAIATDIDIVNVNNVVIFPSPAKDELRIINYEATLGISQLQKGDILQIMDISGRMITNYEMQIISDKEIRINIAALPQGVYLLKLKNFSGKFLKIEN